MCICVYVLRRRGGGITWGGLEGWKKKWWDYNIKTIIKNTHSLLNCYLECWTVVLEKDKLLIIQKRTRIKFSNMGGGQVHLRAGACWGQKKVFEPLEPEVQWPKAGGMGDGNQTESHCRTVCFLHPEPSLVPFQTQKLLMLSTHFQNAFCLNMICFQYYWEINNSLGF